MTARPFNTGRVPARAQQLAGQLSDLFETDRQLVARLNDASRRLDRANNVLFSGVHPDALRLVYGHTDLTEGEGSSMIARLVLDAYRDSRDEQQLKTVVLELLAQAHWAIHHAACDYQSACEERRQLAVTVGELAQQLTDTLTAAGWSRAAARNANVHQLAGLG